MLVANIMSAWDQSVDLRSECWLISSQVSSCRIILFSVPTHLIILNLGIKTHQIGSNFYWDVLCHIRLSHLTYNHLSNSYSNSLVKLNNIINGRIFPQNVAFQTIYIKSRWIYKSVHCSIDTYWTHCVQRLHTRTHLGRCGLWCQKDTGQALPKWHQKVITVH